VKRHLPVLCIVGPTATGKSDLGVRIAREVGGEVLSADSMQVYRSMDIGTAKITAAEMGGIPHHLLDQVDPDVRFTVADWTKAADTAIHDVVSRGRLPIVVGGTGLYIKAIAEDLAFAAAKGSTEIRARWQEFADRHGEDQLHEELSARDPETAARLHPNDVRRVIRALEVSELRQQPLSSDYDWSIKDGRYEVVQYGLISAREVLYERVNQRVDRMMEVGLLAEVEGLRRRGYERHLASMQAIGYKELYAHLEGESSLPEAVDQVKQSTRRFVKRQLSWFRRDPRVHWIQVANKGSITGTELESILVTGRQMLAGIRSSRRE